MALVMDLLKRLMCLEASDRVIRWTLEALGFSLYSTLPFSFFPPRSFHTFCNRIFGGYSFFLSGVGGWTELGRL